MTDSHLAGRLSLTGLAGLLGGLLGGLIGVVVGRQVGGQAPGGIGDLVGVVIGGGVGVLLGLALGVDLASRRLGLSRAHWPAWLGTTIGGALVLLLAEPTRLNQSTVALVVTFMLVPVIIATGASWLAGRR